MPEDSPVNIGELLPVPFTAGQRVLGMQTKLHRWAAADPGRRFDDLYNLVADPAFLAVAWERVSGNTGARSAGVDRRTVRSITESALGAVGLLEELRADEQIETEPADPITPDQIYERRWALTVLERVLSRLKDEYLAAGNAALFDSLKELLPDEPGSPSQGEIAGRLRMTENALRQAFYRFRQRYQALLREEIANTVATPGDIEDELRHLIAVLEA